MNSLLKINLFLKLFGLRKVPLIAFVNPKITECDASHVVVKIKHSRRTKNHLNSLYMGSLVIGADIAAGFLAVYLAHHKKLKISLAFKAISAEFLKRPEHDVLFRCLDGELIEKMLIQSMDDNIRINEDISVIATCPKQFGFEPVAIFKLTLSIKVLT